MAMTRCRVVIATREGEGEMRLRCCLIIMVGEDAEMALLHCCHGGRERERGERQRWRVRRSCVKRVTVLSSPS